MAEKTAGTVFEQGEKEQGEWFPFFASKLDMQTGQIEYDPPEEGAAEFCFRNLTPFWEARRKAQKKESKWVKDPDTREMMHRSFYPDLSFDEAMKERDDSWDFAITGMRNARWDEGGPEMACTRENKLKLVKNAMFLRYANRVIQMLHETGVKKAEALPKN